MSDEKTPVSALRAIAHPVRLQMLSLLTSTDMSAAEVAREMDLTHANASYHLRVLVDAGEIVVAGEEKIRGGIAKRYRHPWQHEARPDGSGVEPTEDDPQMYIRAVAEELVRRFGQRRSGTRTLLSDAEMWVEPEVWEQVMQHVEAASSLMHSAAQPPRTPGTLHANLTSLAFLMEDKTTQDTTGEDVR
ncbi:MULTISPECIES: ArsR/SmtB family transcription factor [unclassified Nocardioides]|uniref:ArsR/SmtB family transcription factor n=1 Tax=unclassified Nocardioides TaxID=2615069 RepID=UPI0009EBD130|nr:MULTISPECIES: helix-turn-helix domain-containing protein [unclassified Nocardioides]